MNENEEFFEEDEEEPEELTTLELLELHRLWLKAYYSIFVNVCNFDLAFARDVQWAIEMELAQQHGIMPEDIPARNTRGAGRPRKATPEITEQIISLKQSGLSVRKIAKQVQVSSATVQRVISANRAKINSDT